VEGALVRLKSPLAIKFGDSIITFRVEGVSDVTHQLASKALSGDRVTVYLKGPAKLFNVYAPSRLPKFSISAVEVLMTGYMLSRGLYTLTENEALRAMRTLGLLVETYYSLRTVKPVLIPHEGREPAMMGKITYIVDTKDASAIGEIESVLRAAEAAGIGRSRQNGYGTISWSPK